MNVWDNIKVAQIVYNLLHQENNSIEILDFDSSCIYCARDSKPRITNYKNFLIYLTNYFQLTNATDETNLTFEKFSRKIEVLIQESEEETNRETVKSVRKNAEEIFETIRLSRTPKTSFNDIVSIIIRVAYRTGVFENAKNIEVAYQLIYQKVISDENYLELSEEKTVTQLLNYIESTSYLGFSSKEKGKDTEDITSLILLTETVRSISPILPAYT